MYDEVITLKIWGHPQKRWGKTPIRVNRYVKLLRKKELLRSEFAKEWQANLIFLAEALYSPARTSGDYGFHEGEASRRCWCDGFQLS